MVISTLHVKNFRNQQDTRLHLDTLVNVFVGQNGAGKTSLLESIHTLSITKSFKAKKESEVLMHKKLYATVSANIQESTREKKLEIRYEQVSPIHIKKTYMIDEKRKRASAFIGELLTVLFTTDLVNTFADKSLVRRKFFNMFLSQLEMPYFSDLLQYEKIIRNKVHVLKMIREGNPVKLLDYWNTELARYGASLIEKRRKFIQDVNDFLVRHEKNHNAICIIYETQFPETDKQHIQQNLQESLVREQQKELITGRCLIGAHRDDYDVLFNGKSIRGIASRGEQKVSLAFLLYAIAQYIAEKKATNPIFLLDDISAELDTKNFQTVQKLFMDSDFQVIMTSLHKDPSLVGKVHLLHPE